MLELNGYKIKLEKGWYEGDQLAITAICWDPDLKFWEPYGTLTKNLNYEGDDPAPEDCAYLDTNNIKNVEEFVKDFAEFTGKRKQSGYCTYPLYKFDIAKLDAIIAEQNKG